MTWKTFHHRGEVLRAVISTANQRRDGVLPMDVPGVVETFGDEQTLLGALQLRWYTRLSGQIERSLVDEPLDLEEAVISAWHAAVRELPGVRLVLDTYQRAGDPRLAEMLSKAALKEHVLLAVMAGQGGPQDTRSAFAGAQIEARARETYRPLPGVRDHRGAGLMDRLRAVLAA